MAYVTGTGANQQDFLYALKEFALGLGWTISRWDTTNKRLYLEKGVCHACFGWSNVNINTYPYKGASVVVVSEGRIFGNLCNTLGSDDDFTTFTGSTALTGHLSNGPLVYMRNMQGSYVGWYLFSNAAGDYIHAIVEVRAGVYSWIGFGNANQAGLTHSGAAYLFSSADAYWYRSTTLYDPPYSMIYYNKPYINAPLSVFNTNEASRLLGTSLQIYSENALPSATFVNQVGMATGRNSDFSTTLQASLGMSNTASTSYSEPSAETSTGAVTYLLSNLFRMNTANYSSVVPMLGVPLICTNTTYTLACMIGMIPDFRCLNLEGLAPAQELTLSTDVWKVFPTLRQTTWADGPLNEAPSSGQYGIAFKKIT